MNGWSSDGWHAEWAERALLISGEIQVHLEDWSRRLLTGQVDAAYFARESTLEARLQLAKHVCMMLTYVLHGCDPWYAHPEVVEEVLARRYPNYCTHVLGAGRALRAEIEACLTHWQRRLLDGLADTEYFTDVSNRALVQELAEHLGIFLLAPVTGYHPWYDHPEALRLALLYGDDPRVTGQGEAV
jgi:hypothetical protein